MLICSLKQTDKRLTKSLTYSIRFAHSGFATVQFFFPVFDSFGYIDIDICGFQVSSLGFWFSLENKDKELANIQEN